MSEPATINSRIIETLYSEALALADDVRAMFSATGRAAPAISGSVGDRSSEDLARVALSCEGLRTTTRMMHAIAWLLNHRAFFMGELSEIQLRRHGQLATDHPRTDPHRLLLLDPEVRDLVEATERFYARLVRLDHGWRTRTEEPANPVVTMRERLARAVR